jgi:hypothetical protein
MELTRENFNKVLEKQLKVDNDLNAKMPELITAFSVILYRIIGKTTSVWSGDTTIKPITKEEMLKEMGCLYSWAASILNQLPEKVEAADGKVQTPRSDTVDSIISAYKDFYNATVADASPEKATAADIAELIGTACELDGNKHLSFLSEFAIMHIYSEMLFPELKQEDFVKAYMDSVE